MTLNPAALTKAPPQTGHLSSRDAVNSRHPYTPIKPAGECWDHIQYVPPWTDPNWQDEGEERDKTDFKIENTFDRLRPAVLPKDQYKRPTKYAHRFSIFPGRLDGRSRTSPTRADSRKLFPANSDVKTGKELFDRFDDLAAQQGEFVDDFMDRTRPDMQQGTEAEQQYMQQYEDLVIDENWQSILFGNLTMDEVHAEEYLTMADTLFDGLSGPIYPLFDRDKWANTNDFGADPATPRFVYNMNGFREEWDPKRNDRVWNAMQPALQLATRFVLADHPFNTCIQDATNLYKVPVHLYENTTTPDPNDVRVKMKPDPDPLDPDLLPGAKQLKNCQGFSAAQISRRVLDKTLELRLTSAFYNSGEYAAHCIGRTAYSGIVLPDYPIIISVDAELIWIVMSDKYSKSEKMMASLVFASTLAHELMHAWACAPGKWLPNPVTFGIFGHAEWKGCKELYTNLCPKGEWGEEPYYDNDPVSEVGHAFESHVLGGSYWGFTNGGKGWTWPRLLTGSAPVISRCLWPEQGSRDKPRTLAAPEIRWAQLSHFVRVEEAQRFFLQGFWDVAVKKYGTAALRDPGKRPHKIHYNPANSWLTHTAWDAAGLGSQDDKQEVFDFLEWLNERGNSVLDAYFTALVMDVADFGDMVARFDDDSHGWDERDAKWSEFQQEALMLIYEYTGFTIMYQALQNPGAVIAPDKISALTRLYSTWNAAMRRLGRCPDPESTIMAGMGENFWRSHVLVITLDQYEGRLIGKLMDLVRLLSDECGWMENVVCEIYRFPVQFWDIYKSRIPRHPGRMAARASKVASALGDLIQAMGAPEFSMPAWTSEWQTRIIELGSRYQTVSRMMALDPSRYEVNWRDMFMSLPRLRTSNKRRHQVWYFLAKKEMLSLKGEDVEMVREFKTNFEKTLNLGGCKIVLPEIDPDELAVAQRWAGTLADESGNNGQGNPIARPSTGIFNTQGVKDLAARLAQEEQQAQTDKLQRAGGDPQAPTLQQAAASQATQAPAIPPKIQQMGMGNQTAPFGAPQQPAPGTGFAAYSSGAGPSFASQAPGTGSAWAPGNPANLAQMVNQFTGAPASLGSGPTGAMTGYGIMPNAYAIRETVSNDLFYATQTIFQPQDPSYFAHHPPRDGEPAPSPTQGVGPLGDVEQTWERQRSTPGAGGSDVDMTDAHRARAFIVDSSSDELGSSNGDYDDRSEGESSEATSVESWDEDEYEARSKAKAKAFRSLKRKAGWMVPNPRQPWLTAGRSQKRRRG